MTLRCPASPTPRAGAADGARPGSDEREVGRCVRPGRLRWPQIADVCACAAALRTWSMRPSTTSSTPMPPPAGGGRDHAEESRMSECSERIGDTVALATRRTMARADDKETVRRSVTRTLKSARGDGRRHRTSPIRKCDPDRATASIGIGASSPAGPARAAYLVCWCSSSGLMAHPGRVRSHFGRPADRMKVTAVFLVLGRSCSSVPPRRHRYGIGVVGRRSCRIIESTTSTRVHRATSRVTYRPAVVPQADAGDDAGSVMRMRHRGRA